MIKHFHNRTGRSSQKDFADRRNPMRQALLLLIPATFAAGCANGPERSDAYGNFETTEIVVSSEAMGRIMTFDVEEGMRLSAGQVVGYIDTLQLALQRKQLLANRGAMLSHINGVTAQTAVLQEQKRVAEVEHQRVLRLIKDHAATSKQLDDVEGQIAVLDKQIVATRGQIATIRNEIDAVDAQIDQLADRIGKSIIANPIGGVVLVKYAEDHELTNTGKPLYKIADLETMYLRAYISGDQLSHLKLGQQVTVLIDESRTETRSIQGEVSWISSEAEFTPKTIQTKEERVNLVYAFKVRVANPDGAIKIGMPGDVEFAQQSGS
ncbi:MAG: HlyD family efflux transporter periplasmic adaptor subunit [Rhodothermales bacterium]